MASLTLQNYATQLPEHIAIKAAEGAIVTATISLCFGSALSVALLGGAIAATATLAEAFTRPLIRNIFPDTPSFIRIFAHVYIPLAIVPKLATLAFPWIGISYKTSSVTLSLLAFFALNPPGKSNGAFAFVF